MRFAAFYIHDYLTYGELKFICIFDSFFLLLRLVNRVQTTLRGSADDIGWLQKMPNALPVEDDTAGFLKALEIIRSKNLTVIAHHNISFCTFCTVLKMKLLQISLVM